jgi:hypothetical protein
MNGALAAQQQGQQETGGHAGGAGVLHEENCGGTSEGCQPRVIVPRRG